MLTNSILLQNLSSDQLTELIAGVFKSQLEDLRKEFCIQSMSDDLMTREEVLSYLKINSSTLYRWQNNRRINVYKFSGKCYYKRSELFDSITILNK